MAWATGAAGAMVQGERAVSLWARRNGLCQCQRASMGCGASCLAAGKRIRPRWRGNAWSRCAAADVDSIRQAMTRLEEDEKGVISTDILEGVQKMTIRSTDSHSGQRGGAQLGG